MQSTECQIINELTHEELIARVRVAAQAQGATIKDLANGGCILTFGDLDNPKLTILSGVHGEERAGPIALLGWLENTDVKKLVGTTKCITIIPCLNDKGWNTGKRRWGRYNLNCHFKEKNCNFLFMRQVMRHLKRNLPDVYLDLHEDTETHFPYAWLHKSHSNDFVVRLLSALNIDEVAYAKPRDWAGTSETYIITLGVTRYTTFETPVGWDLADRVKLQLKAITFAVQELLTLE